MYREPKAAAAGILGYVAFRCPPVTIETEADEERGRPAEPSATRCFLRRQVTYYQVPVSVAGEPAMITAIVHFPLPEPLTLDEAREVFRSTAPIYQDMPGLVRKVYLLSEDGRTAGGAYLWETREAAERAFGDEWRRRIVERYGAEPSVAYFASPVIVDNLSGQILAD